MPLALAAFAAVSAMCTVQEPAPPDGAPGLAQDGLAQGGLTQAELEQLTADIRIDIERLRARKFHAPVSVSLADRKKFFDYALEREASTTKPAQRRTQQLESELLGLIDANTELREIELALLSKQVGGFYDPASDSFCLMEGFTKPVARVILSHELTHALDDQLFDIDGTLAKCADSSDAQLAFQSVVEGSGMAVMREWMMAEIKAKRLSMSDLTNAPGMSMDGLDEAPEALWKPLLCAYLQGASFLVKSEQVLAGQMKSVDTDDIERAFRSPPRSTEQVLHPEKYWDAVKRDEPRRVRIESSALPSGWSEVGQDTLGEVGLALVTTPREEREAPDVATLLAARFTNDAASGWDGDRCAVFEKGGAAVVVVHSVWDTAADAAEFAAAVEGLKKELEGNLAKRGGGVGVCEVAKVGEAEVRVWCASGCEAGELQTLKAAVGAKAEDEAK